MSRAGLRADDAHPTSPVRHRSRPINKKRTAQSSTHGSSAAGRPSIRRVPAPIGRAFEGQGTHTLHTKHSTHTAAHHIQHVHVLRSALPGARAAPGVYTKRTVESASSLSSTTRKLSAAEHPITVRGGRLVRFRVARALDGGRLERGTSSCTRREGVWASAWGEDARSMRSMQKCEHREMSRDDCCRVTL
jgi:hypothetical protein